MLKDNKKKVFKSVKMLTVAAMLTAMSVVIGMVCKTFLNFGDGLLRVTFENLPIIISGILFGPIVGGLVGAASDLISYLLTPQQYSPNLVVTAGAFSIGAISGIIAKYVLKKKNRVQIIVSAASAHIIGSMIIKTIGIYQYFQWMALVRIPLYIVIGSVEIFLLCLLFKSNSFRRAIDY